MTLKMELENLEGLSEDIQKLYIQKDGKYIFNVDGHDKNDNKIPLTRLNQEIEKRKSIEQELATIAESFKNDVPEAMQDLVPDLPPGKLIAWLQSAKKLFDPKQPIDSKKTGDKKPVDFDGMSPTAIMSQGYGKK